MRVPILFICVKEEAKIQLEITVDGVVVTSRPMTLLIGDDLIDQMVVSMDPTNFPSEINLGEQFDH